MNTNLDHEVREIVGDDAALEDWTAEMAEDDFYCATPVEAERVRAIFDLLAERLDEAYESNSDYVRAFARFLERDPEGFQSSAEELRNILRG